MVRNSIAVSITTDAVNALDSLRVCMSKQVYVADMAIGPGPGPVILTDVFAFCWRIQWSVCMFVCFIVSAFCNGWMYLCMHIY